MRLTSLLLLAPPFSLASAEVVDFGTGIIDAIQLFTPGGVSAQLVTGEFQAEPQLFAPGAVTAQRVQ